MLTKDFKLELNKWLICFTVNSVIIKIHLGKLN